MSLQVFHNGDTPYLQWMDANPNAFVLNTGKGNKSTYAVLHKSNCLHIATTTRLDEGAYTTRGYIKVGADKLQEILAWLAENRPRFTGKMKACKTCKPTADTPAS